MVNQQTKNPLRLIHSLYFLDNNEVRFRTILLEAEQISEDHWQAVVTQNAIKCLESGCKAKGCHQLQLQREHQRETSVPDIESFTES